MKCTFQFCSTLPYKNESLHLCPLAESTVESLIAASTAFYIALLKHLYSALVQEASLNLSICRFCHGLVHVHKYDVLSEGCLYD